MLPYVVAWFSTSAWTGLFLKFLGARDWCCSSGVSWWASFHILIFYKMDDFSLLSFDIQYDGRYFVLFFSLLL